MSLTILVYVYFATLAGLGCLTSARKVDARNDICARIPTFSACQQNGQQAQPTRNQQQVSQADLPQPTSGQPATATDKATFCRQYQAHYTYFCTDGAPGNRQAPSFCRSYTNNCNTSAAPDSSTSTNPFGNGAQMSRQEIDTKCQQYKSMASQYCTGAGTESTMAKPYCDAYRKYCTSSQSADTPSSSRSSSSGEDDMRQKIKYCTRYQSQYNSYCSGQRPTGRVSTFCYAYKDYCGNLPRVDDSDSSSTSTKDSGLPHKRPLPAFANYNNSAQVRRLCDQYQWTANKACTGFETQELREYCNMYRVYCQGKDPVPSIDGSLGFNKDSWGVAGIPYYPFNPQGAIGGGERDTVGFGDWGGSFSQRKGVTDFWDQNKQVNANWQKGQYGYNQGWNVPLLGIGGYKTTAVNLGGIANPGDFPSAASGGVLPGMSTGNGLPSFGGPMLGGGMPTVNGGLGGPMGGMGGLGGLGNLLG